MSGPRRSSGLAGPALAAALAVLAGGTPAHPAYACDLCAVYAALEARESSPGLYASLFEQYTDFGTLRLDGDKVANEDGQDLRSSLTQVVVGYQFNRRFGVQANVPLIDRSFRRPEGDAIERGSVSGLGDTTVLAHYRAVERYVGDTTGVWSFLGGVKLPTGDSSRLAEEAAEGGLGEEPEAAGSGAVLVGAHEDHGEPSGIHGHDLALGSGSVDGLVGTSGFFRWRRWLLNVEAQYVLRRPGGHDYRFADDLTWSVAPGYFVVLDEGRSLSLALAFSGEQKGEDRFAGERATDTAVDAVYAGPALAYASGQRLYAQLAFDLPVEQHNSALQIVPDRRLRCGLTWRW
jgi:hypothetical protein